MADVSRLVWSLKLKEIKWFYDGKEHSKLLCDPIGNAIILNDGSGFITIEEALGVRAENASIWNGDGSLRCIPKNPFGKDTEFRFYYVEYIGNILHFVLASRERDFGIFVNQNTCEILKTHEAR